MVAAETALAILRTRLSNPTFAHSHLKSSSESNYSKLKFIISSSIAEACNNSVLLLGPRGSGKVAVAELVLEDLKAEHADEISVEIARQLCLEHRLLFSKMASSDDNSQFMIDMLRECGLAHKTTIFVLDEFDLFTQGKQRLLYSLLDALQTLTSQAVVIGMSCRLDADQLLEKRVRSRFSNRKLLFIPPSADEMQRLIEHLLYLPKDSGLPTNFVTEFNSRLSNIISDKKFKEIVNSISAVDGTISNLLTFLFRAVSYMDVESGFLMMENFKSAELCMQKQPKIDCLQDEHEGSVQLYIFKKEL
ncbi:Origin of replication complex subunit 4 [Ananas comosus]|uniref:Origin of replication complex subunit 4 n=1 Tax=Ananas comosus TaxID=4615 RepID=A0A199W0G1_ANACO|nr:Origin of replication complex subunit 4 [Ananas comosus]